MPNPDRMLVDTNVLIYAINKSSPKHKKAQQFLLDKQLQLVIAHQNVFEALRVLTHPKYPNPLKIKGALASVGAIASAITLVSPTNETNVLAQTLLEKYQATADRIFDMYLVATMLSHEITFLATDNERDFQNITEIKVFNPFKKTLLK